MEATLAGLRLLRGYVGKRVAAEMLEVLIEEGESKIIVEVKRNPKRLKLACVQEKERICQLPSSRQIERVQLVLCVCVIVQRHLKVPARSIER
jgi:tRNA threonylcarbamoyladenosine modification (KEOPS) complex Cgi121 subunit